jgi:hypothetical protein
MSKLLGKVQSKVSTGLSKVATTKSEDSFYFKDSNILGTPTTGTTKCTVDITCDNMKSLIEQVKTFKVTRVTNAKENLIKEISSINQTDDKKIKNDIERAYKSFVYEAGNNLVPLNIDVSVDVGKSMVSKGNVVAPGLSGKIVSLDLAKKVITVKYYDKSITTEVKYLCVKNDPSCYGQIRQ